MPLYVATRTFQVGNDHLRVEEGDQVEFTGTHARVNGGPAVIMPQFRGAVTAGWLVLDEGVRTSVDGSHHMIEAARIVSRHFQRHQRNEMSPEEREAYERAQDMLRVNREQRQAMHFDGHNDFLDLQAEHTHQTPSPVEYRGRTFELIRGFGHFEAGSQVIVTGRGTHGGLMVRTAVQSGVMFSAVVPEDYLREVGWMDGRGKPALERLMDDD